MDLLKAVIGDDPADPACNLLLKYTGQSTAGGPQRLCACAALPAHHPVLLDVLRRLTDPLTLAAQSSSAASTLAHSCVQYGSDKKVVAEDLPFQHLTLPKCTIGGIAERCEKETSQRLGASLYDIGTYRRCGTSSSLLSPGALLIACTKCILVGRTFDCST